MSNTLLSPTVIAKEALMQLENQCVLGNMVHRAYKKEFVKVGNSVTIPKPVKFVSNSGADISSAIQNVEEQSTSVTIDQRRNVAWQFSSQELTLNIKDYSEKYIKPAIIQLANDVDVSLAGLYKYVPMAAGTAGTTPSTFANLGAAAQMLDDNAVQQDMRRMVIDPAARWATADSFKNFYNSDVAAKAQKGMLAKGLAGFGDIAMDQNVAYHTAGNTAGTTLVDGAGQVGATLHIDGLTTATAALKAGDVFTIAGVYHVNPVSKVSTGKLQQFTVTADVSAAGNEVDLPIYPSIVTSGALQTVSAGPADGAVVSFIGSHKANLAFHKNAFGLVCVDLEMPDSTTFKSRASHNGLSIRVVKGYDIKLDVEIIRLDILYGVKALYPELASRLMG